MRIDIFMALFTRALLLSSNLLYTLYPRGHFDPSCLNLQKMIIIKTVTQIYVLGALCSFVDYLNNHLNKILPQPPLHPPHYTSRTPIMCLSKNI